MPGARRPKYLNSAGLKRARGRPEAGKRPSSSPDHGMPGYSTASQGVDVHGLEQGPGFLYSAIAACVVGGLYALSFWVLDRESVLKRCVDVLLPFTPFLLVIPMFMFDEPGVKMPDEVAGRRGGNPSATPLHRKKAE